MTSVAYVQQQIDEFLGNRARKLAKETFAIQRERKFNGSSLLQTLVFGYQQQPQSTLDHLVSTAAVANVEVSDTAILKHFTPETATFLLASLQELTQIVVQAKEAVPLPLLRRFPAIVFEDSSIINLPVDLAAWWEGTGGRNRPVTSTVKLHICWELGQGRLWGPALTDGRHSDRRSPWRDEELPVGSLKINDLGYFETALFKERQEQGIRTLGRLHATVGVYDRQGKCLDVEHIAPKQVGQAKEVPILLGRQERLPMRLLQVRVPHAVAEERREDIKREAKQRGTPVSEKALRLASWTLLFTDVPRDELSIEEALILMRERWQMELLYKLWKQEGEVDAWVSENPWRILCELYAKLIGLLLQHWMIVLFTWHDPQRSLVKCAQVMRETGWTIMEALAGRRSLRSALNTIRDRMRSGCRMNKRHAHPNSAQLLEDGLDWTLELLA
jgi:hypothetical protein